MRLIKPLILLILILALVMSFYFCGINLLYFKKISMHEHYHAGGNMEAYLKAATSLNIREAIFFPTDWPTSNPAYKQHLEALLNLKKKYPDKIIAFATAWSKDPQAAEIIENALKNGAQGIKFVDWLYSEEFPNAAGIIDGENMYKVYRIAEKYNVPILIHIDFQKKLEWKAAFDRVAKDFPNVKFILPHYCRAASGETPALDLCSDTLDKFPNVFVDISMGEGLKRYMFYFDNDHKLFRDFIIRYQDKVLWGADTIIDNTSFKNEDWFRRRILADIFILEKAVYKSPFYKDDPNLYNGLDLPRNVLKKIYWDNPNNFFSLGL